MDALRRVAGDPVQCVDIDLAVHTAVGGARQPLRQ